MTLEPREERLAEIRDGLAVLVGDREVFELRAFKRGGGAERAYFTREQIEAAARWALDQDRYATGVYVSVNDIDPVAVRSKPESEATRTEDVRRHTTFLVDTDAVRRIDGKEVAGSRTDATDEERAAAHALGERVAAFLRRADWFDPVTVETPNGAQRWYPVDLPNDDASAKLKADALAGLALLFDDDDANVDTSVGKAAQVARLPATTSRKGANTPDRPHRRARLVSCPLGPGRGVVTREQLQALAGLAPKPDAADAMPKAATAAYNGPALDVEARLAAWGLKVKRTAAYADGRKWVMERCPGCGNDNDDHPLVVVRRGDGRLGGTCKRASCPIKSWSDLREHFEPGYRDRRGLHAVAEEPAPAYDDADPGPWGDGPSLADAAHRTSWPDPIPLGEIAVPTFPVECLSPWMAEWSRATAESLQVPVDLAGCTALGVAAAALHGKVEAEVRPGWREILALYIAEIAASGERKSAAKAAGRRPILEWQAGEAARMAGPIREAQAKRSVLTERLKGLKRKAAKADAAEAPLLAAEMATLTKELDESPIPQPPRLLCDDVTVERLGELMQQHGPMAIVTAEGDFVELLGGRYTEGKPNLGLALRAYSGDPFFQDRVSRPAIYIEKPSLVLSLAVQPEVLEALGRKPEFKNLGMNARILFSIPRPMVGHREARPEPMSRRATVLYRSRVTGLLRLPAGPRVLQFSRAADDLIAEFQAWLEPQLGRGGDLQHMAEWGAKAAGNAARLATIFHVCDRVRGGDALAGEVEGGCAERAVELVRDYFLPHARLAHRRMAMDADLEMARYLLRHVAEIAKRRAEQRQPLKVSVRDLHQKCKSVLQRVEDLTPLLRVLEDHAWVQAIEMQRRPRPGRPDSPVYAVNPAILTHRQESDSRISKSCSEDKEDHSLDPHFHPSPPLSEQNPRLESGPNNPQNGEPRG